MAKENKSGEVVEVLEDEGPEEGEIEDDTSDEDNVKNFGISSSNISQVNASMGAKYFQTPCSTSKEARKKKPQVHTGEKSEKSWGNANRRRYKFYVDHDNPSREPYDRLKKSDVNSDHRGLNFHDLLSEYKTSKHENEGNTHEKENRHYGKEVRLDSSRKRESLVNDILSDKAKRGRKRKHRRSPSPSPVSSEPDGRRRKEIRTTRPRRRKKPSLTTRNSKESALIFAQIRASKLNSQQIGEKKPSVELINVVSEGEHQAEVSMLPGNDGKPFHSEGEGNQMGKNTDSEAVLREGDLTNLSKDPSCCVPGKGSFTASDSQTAEKIEDSESKDEDDDDVLQLRMIALQSAFRAKYLARKRLGLTKKNSNMAKSCVESSVNSILDDTEELLEAAEDLTSSLEKEPECDNMFTSLAEVPLPPDEPLNPPALAVTQVEDLTPVDMELALTDEEDANLEPGKDNACDVEFPNDGLHPIVRISRSMMKTKTIPVTIGRKQHHKVRQRSSINKQEICRRKNLLEVITAGNEEVDLANLDSSVVGIEDVGMYSMEINDPAEIHYSADYFHNLDEDCALSEASDTKSDSISAYTGQIPSLSNDNEDEDEELLRAKLLLDISKRHRKEEAVIKSTLTLVDLEEKTKPVEQVMPAYVVKRVQPESTMVNSAIKVNGDSSIVQAIAISHDKIKTKRVVERIRKGNMLLKAQAIKSAHAKQYPITTLVKGRVSKMSNRGKYQRINQIRTAISKKKLDGNIQVTVAGSNSKTKVVSQAPKQQDRIVICLGEDSDDSEDDKETDCVEPQMDTSPKYSEKGFGNQWERAYHQMMDPKPFVHIVYPESGPEMKVEDLFKGADSTQVARIPVDFEKSVDLFLKEVRSVQESKSKTKQPTSGASMAKSEAQPTHPAVVKPKAAMNTPQAVKSNLKSLTGITPQAVRHLPFPQQEEYRRLKMQISILEMQKKRKAGEVSQVPPKLDQKEGPPANTLPLSKSNQVSSKNKMEDSANNACESNNTTSLQSDLLSKNKEIHEKSSEKPSEASTTAISDGGFDDNIEDENVMREQLLRSRLRKRAAAKTEVLPPVREPESIPTLPSQSSVEVGDLAKLTSAGETSSLVVVRESNEPPEKVKPVLSLNSEKAAFSKENEISSTGEPDVQESKASEVCSATSITEETPLTEIANVQVLHGNASLNTKLEVGEGIGEKREACDAKEGAIKNISLEGKETTGKRQVTNVEVDAVKKVSEDHVLPGVRVNGRETVAKKELPSDSITRDFAGTTKKGQLHSGVLSARQGVESKETQLKDLENKLLSERHAALDYLKELQQLLNTMEIEGNRLREKEAAVKKLRTELSLAEVSLLTQKRLMKHLAINVSSVRTRVTETRHKCTLLSRACQKLGNQIKQQEIANGGERTVYRVPTGVAELVKSQLSSVLFRRKQLKKSSLPFLDSSQEFTSKDGYSVKKSGKKFVRVNQQPHSSTWAKHHLASNRSNLKLERASTFSPSKFVKFVQSSSSSIKSGAANNSAVDSQSVLSTSASIKNTLPVVKGLVTSAKSSSSTKESSNPLVADLSANQTATKEVHVPDSNSSLVVAGPSSVAVDGVSSVSRTNASSFILMPSDSSRQTDAENSNLLREYESPLTSISSRTASEKLTTETSTLSENIQVEESMNLDPNVMLCPYDLRGVCQDEECTYQHQRRKGVAKKS